MSSCLCTVRWRRCSRDSRAMAAPTLPPNSSAKIKPWKSSGVRYSTCKHDFVQTASVVQIFHSCGNKSFLWIFRESTDTPSLVGHKSVLRLWLNAKYNSENCVPLGSLFCKADTNSGRKFQSKEDCCQKRTPMDGLLVAALELAPGAVGGGEGVKTRSRQQQRRFDGSGTSRSCPSHHRTAPQAAMNE